MKTLSRFQASRWCPAGLAIAAMALTAGCDHSIRRSRVEATQVIELMATDVQKVAAFVDNGHIHVRPSTTSDTIRILATIVASGRDPADAEACLKAVEILTPRTGPGEEIQEVRWGSKGNRSLYRSVSVSFDIEMPASLELAATSDNGEIDVVAVLGNRELKSDNGRIHVSDWLPTEEPVWDGSLAATDARIVAATDNGAIEVESAAGALVLETDNGSIDARSAARQVRFAANNGAIQARLTAAGRIDGRIQSDNGSVSLILNPEVSTRLDCQSDRGGIARVGLAINEQYSESDHRLKCAIGTGEGLLEIETDNGPINLESMPRRPRIYH